jgi:MFS family permease
MLTDVIPPQKRSTAFGSFDNGYGIAWFLGSAAMGLLMTNQSWPWRCFQRFFSLPRYLSFLSRIRSARFLMDPYAKPKERKTGAQRPKISHRPSALETRTRREREAEKQAVAAQRRAIKKSARRHLRQELLAELEEND